MKTQPKSSHNLLSLRISYRGNQSIYLHHSGPLLENGLDRPKNRYGRYRWGGNQRLPLKMFFSCSLGGGGRYFSVPRASAKVASEIAVIRNAGRSLAGWICNR